MCARTVVVVLLAHLSFSSDIFLTRVTLHLAQVTENVSHGRLRTTPLSPSKKPKRQVWSRLGVRALLFVETPKFRVCVQKGWRPLHRSPSVLLHRAATTFPQGALHERDLHQQQTVSYDRCCSQSDTARLRNSIAGARAPSLSQKRCKRDTDLSRVLQEAFQRHTEGNHSPRTHITLRQAWRAPPSLSGGSLRPRAPPRKCRGRRGSS